MRNLRRLQFLEEAAARCQAQRDEEGDAMERLTARLDAIRQRLRVAGVVFEVDHNEMAERMGLVRVEMQRLAAQQRFNTL